MSALHTARATSQSIPRSRGGASGGVRIRVDNDARRATRYELHLGTGREYKSFVCIFVGTGVGSGVAINRRIYFGEPFCSGEVGH